MKYNTLLLFVFLILSCSIDDDEIGYGKEDDIQFLNDIIELNNLSEETTPLDNDNGDGNFTALELGWKQEWENDRLTYLDLAGWIPGDQDSSIYNIKVIPASIEKADKLKYLTIHNSDLSIIPEEILSHPSMVNLHLALNKIKEIPEGIYNMKDLEVLALQLNQIKIVPSTIANCPKLEGLSLFGNQIEKLPESIWDIKNLKRFNVSSNLLTSLPDHIDKVEYFNSLYINNNYISELPVGFENIVVKWYFDISHNFLFCSDGQLDSSLVPEYLLTGQYTDVAYTLYNQDCGGK